MTRTRTLTFATAQQCLPAPSLTPKHLLWRSVAYVCTNMDCGGYDRELHRLCVHLKPCPTAQVPSRWQDRVDVHGCSGQDGVGQVRRCGKVVSDEVPRVGHFGLQRQPSRSTHHLLFHPLSSQQQQWQVHRTQRPSWTHSELPGTNSSANSRKRVRRGRCDQSELTPGPRRAQGRHRVPARQERAQGPPRRAERQARGLLQG